MRRYCASSTVSLTSADVYVIRFRNVNAVNLASGDGCERHCLTLDIFQVRTENRQPQLCVISTFHDQRRRLGMFCRIVFFRHKLTVGILGNFTRQRRFTVEALKAPVAYGVQLDCWKSTV